MKFFAIIFTLCICIISCKKNSDIPAIPLFETTINDVYWKADSVLAVEYPGDVPFSSFRIAGWSKNGTAFFLYTNSDTVSSYDFSGKANLAYFRATLNFSEGNNIHLRWATVTEDSTDKFIIERSFDGRTFSEVGEVKAAGSSSGITEYMWNEKPPLYMPFENRYYYRLRIMNVDGSYEYSPVYLIFYSTPALYIFNNDDYSFGYNGNVSITSVDKNKKIISGTFNFKCINDNDGKTIEIKKGRFENISYQ